MNTSLLEQELAPLNAQIEEVRGTLAGLEDEMRAAEAELELFSADRLRFDLLREACNALERLDAMEARELFWGDVPQVEDPAGHVVRLRTRIAKFDEEIRVFLEKQADLKGRINRNRDELDYLYDEVQEAHIREERRQEEFVIERELSEVAEHPLVMPWSHDSDMERRYRRTMLTAMLLTLLLTAVVRMVHVPVPVRLAVVEVPERLAMMVRKEPKRPEPVRKSRTEKEQAKKDAEKADPKANSKEEKKQIGKVREQPTPERAEAPVEQAAAPPSRKVQNTGVLAFKESLKELMDDTPVAKLGAEARLSNPASYAAGQARASRSLVSVEGGGGPGRSGGNSAVSRNVGSGGSGGIGNAAISRSVGGGGGRDARFSRGDGGFAKVRSTIPGPTAKESRPVSSGARAGRTEEEIQILFDRYKAALYRIYNTELRKDPALRGKIVLRIAIEPSGVVSACAVESSNMNAPEFCDQIVERVRKFNFGPKEGVPKMAILYPIDFLPAR